MTIEKSDLAARMKRDLGKGMILGRQRDATTPFSSWQRDLAHCLNMLFREATSCTSAIFHETHLIDEKGFKDSMECLDTIVQMLMKIYSECYKNNLGGLGHFRELYDYIGDTPLRQSVYATFCSAFVQTVWCYMFTSSEMAIGLNPSIDNDTLDFNSVMNVVSVLDDDLKQQVLQQMMERGMMPTNVDYSKLFRRLTPFLDAIQEDQKRRYKIQEKKDAREASASKDKK